MAQITLLLFGFLALFLSIDAVSKRDHNDYKKNPYRVVCYFGSWAHYHKDAHFEITDIDTKLCTHINYGFAKLDEFNYTIQVFDPWLDEHLLNYKNFIDLRKENPELTLMIALGGWYEGSEKYSDMARNETRRKGFVKSVVDFLDKYGFDGIDIDWEYPGNRLGDPKVDKENFVTLLKELRAALQPEGYVLTAAFSPGKPTIDLAYDLPEINKILDWFNVMAYDYHGGWEDFLGHNAPLYRRPNELDEISLMFNVNFTVNYYIEKGVDKKNIVMGMPFYGRAWTLLSPDKVHLNDTVKGTSPAGWISGVDGCYGYNEICQMEIKEPEKWVNKYDPYYRAPYAYNKEIWVGYDNVPSLSCKVAFLKKLGLSGGMAWSLEFDDFKDSCQGGKYPLLNKVWSMLNGNEKTSYECKFDDVIPTDTPTPSTTPTTPIPTTPSTASSTEGPSPSPTTEHTRVTTEPTPTHEPTTMSSTSTTHFSIVDFVCPKAGFFAYPPNRHKYIECEYIAEGSQKGWWVFIRDCSPGTRWHQGLQTCIADDDNYY